MLRHTNGYNLPGWHGNDDYPQSQTVRNLQGHIKLTHPTAFDIIGFTSNDFSHGESNLNIFIAQLFERATLYVFN